MGPKVVQKWVFGCKSGSKCVTFAPTLNPLWLFHENPLFTQFKGGGNCFPKRALRQSWPSIMLRRIPFPKTCSKSHKLQQPSRVSWATVSPATSATYRVLLLSIARLPSQSKSALTSHKLPAQVFNLPKFQKYPQYCWEFHDRLWEALSGPYWGERILEMLWSLQMPLIIGLGRSQPYSRGMRAFPGSFRNFSGISSGKSQPYWGYGPKLQERN